MWSWTGTPQVRLPTPDPSSPLQERSAAALGRDGRQRVVALPRISGTLDTWRQRGKSADDGPPATGHVVVPSARGRCPRGLTCENAASWRCPPDRGGGRCPPADRKAPGQRAPLEHHQPARPGRAAPLTRTGQTHMVLHAREFFAELELPFADSAVVGDTYYATPIPDGRLRLRINFSPTQMGQRVRRPAARHPPPGPRRTRRHHPPVRRAQDVRSPRLHARSSTAQLGLRHRPDWVPWKGAHTNGLRDAIEQYSAVWFPDASPVRWTTATGTTTTPPTGRATRHCWRPRSASISPTTTCPVLAPGRPRRQRRRPRVQQPRLGWRRPPPAPRGAPRRARLQRPVEQMLR